MRLGASRRGIWRIRWFGKLMDSVTWSRLIFKQRDCRWSLTRRGDIVKWIELSSLDVWIRFRIAPTSRSWSFDFELWALSELFAGLSDAFCEICIASANYVARIASIFLAQEVGCSIPATIGRSLVVRKHDLDRLDYIHHTHERIVFFLVQT